MPEVDTIESPKIAGFVSRKANNNKERIEREEKEVEELEKKLRGEGQEAEKESSDATTKEGEAASNKEGDTDEDEGLSSEQRNYKKRYGDLRRHQQKVEADLKKEIEDLKARVNAGDKINPPKSDEDIEAWIKKYPDVAGVVQGLIAKETEKRLADSKTDLDELRKSQETNKLEKSRRAILEAHSDFEELEDSDGFHDWVDDQPDWISKALFENSDDAKAVIRVLDLYKSDTSGITPKKKSDKDAATSISTKGRSTPDASNEKGKIRESDVQKMSNNEYAKREDEIMEAMATGKFIYDVSGGAR